MSEFIWAKLFDTAVDMAVKRLGKVRFEVSDFDASIQGTSAKEANHSPIAVVNPYAPSKGDLDMSLNGAFFYDSDAATALSQFGFAFRANDPEAAKSALIDATTVISYADSGKTGADYGGRINLPSRKFVEAHFRASVAKAELGRRKRDSSEF